MPYIVNVKCKGCGKYLLSGFERQMYWLKDDGTKEFLSHPGDAFDVHVRGKELGLSGDELKNRWGWAVRVFNTATNQQEYYDLERDEVPNTALRMDQIFLPVKLDNDPIFSPYFKCRECGGDPVLDGFFIT